MKNFESKLQRLKEIIQNDGIATKEKQKIISPNGQEDTWLFDLRNIFLNPEALNLIADIFWHRYEKEYPFQVGGQEVAAIPLVAAIVMKSEYWEKPVSGFFIRKSRKPVGLQKIIEGSLTDEKIILVDDLINGGSTASRQMKIIESFGKKVDSYFTLVNFRGKTNIELLSRRDIKLFSLFSPQDFNLPLEEKKPGKGKLSACLAFSIPEPQLFMGTSKIGSLS